MKRRQLIGALGAGTLNAIMPALAQQPPKVRRIGFLAARARSTPSNPDVYYDAFVQGMRELGYEEGKNLVIEWRFAEARVEHLPGLADELVAAKVEVIVTHGSFASRAAQSATDRIPIVFAAVSDPVSTGLVAQLAHPGGNITGRSQMAVDLLPKQLEFLHVLVPKLSRVAFLSDPVSLASGNLLKVAQAAAAVFGAKIVPVKADSKNALQRGFAAMRKDRIDAVVVPVHALFIGPVYRRLITGLALEHRMPSIFAYREDVEAGGLISYGANVADIYRLAARHVDKILKGAKPADLPVEQPTNIHLAINRKTAKALGLKIPQELILRADEVIE